MPDHQGSVRQTLNQNGTVVTQQTAYDAFGRATPEVSESGGDPGSRFGYTGQERDFDTGLMDYGARWYDPMLGRFLSAHPISEGTNDFVYVFNNPVLHLIHRWCSDASTSCTELIGESGSLRFGEPLR